MKLLMITILVTLGLACTRAPKKVDAGERNNAVGGESQNENSDNSEGQIPSGYPQDDDQDMTPSLDNEEKDSLDIEITLGNGDTETIKWDGASHLVKDYDVEVKRVSLN